MTACSLSLSLMWLGNNNFIPSGSSTHTYVYKTLYSIVTYCVILQDSYCTYFPPITFHIDVILVHFVGLFCHTQQEDSQHALQMCDKNCTLCLCSVLLILARNRKQKRHQKLCIWQYCI